MLDRAETADRSFYGPDVSLHVHKAPCFASAAPIGYQIEPKPTASCSLDAKARQRWSVVACAAFARARVLCTCVPWQGN
jgi:hypothetical protein